MSLISHYNMEIKKILDEIEHFEEENILKAAELVAQQILKDKLFYVYGPGGHSNLAAQEVFFRAGGLMHANAILDEGTLLNNGALRSMKIERIPGYGKIVIEESGMEENDLLLIVNAYGINSATIDAALEAKKRGVTIIGISSVKHAENTPSEHPARHPKKMNLHDIVDLHIDSKLEVGDAVIHITGQEQKVGAMSTFVNAFILNCVTVTTVDILAEKNIEIPIWKSGNATGGDEWNNKFISRFKNRVKHL